MSVLAIVVCNSLVCDNCIIFPVLSLFFVPRFAEFYVPACILLRHFVCAQQVERGDTSIYIVFFNTTKLKEICPFYPLSF